MVDYISVKGRKKTSTKLYFLTWNPCTKATLKAVVLYIIYRSNAPISHVPMDIYR